MGVTEIIVYVIEIVGTVAFAITGAMIAIKHDLDIFGVIFLGVVVALGGGTMRDIILGINPPKMFSNYVFVVVAMAAAILVFVFASAWRKAYVQHVRRLDQFNNVFDALGLAAFTVTGVEAAIAAGFGDNMFLCVMMGMTTAVGGGIIRDICVHEIPMVFRKNIYALASIFGGLLYYVMYALHAPMAACTFVTLAATFGLRLLAIIFHLNLPHAGVNGLPE